MRTYTFKKPMLFVFALLVGMMISIDFIPHTGILIGMHSAYAKVGRPLTPGSVAGVHRRHVRRHHYHHHYYPYNNYYNYYRY